MAKVEQRDPMDKLKPPAFSYYLDESDPDVVVVRRQDGSFVAADGRYLVAFFKTFAGEAI